jgi:hypothetical protein
VFSLLSLVAGIVTVFILICATIPVDHRKLPGFVRNRWLLLDHSEEDTIPRIAIPSRSYSSLGLWAWRAFVSFFLVLSQASQLSASTVLPGTAFSASALFVGAAEAVLLVAWCVYLGRTFRAARTDARLNR